MSIILNIDTAVQTASICLSEDTAVAGLKLNPTQKDHASWLHPAIQQLLAERGRSLQELDAVAVSAGPGSYTGLRVGMAAAKGLCYALNIPLIAVNTLQMMAAAAPKDADWLCPMIDARRMEVFTAVYDHLLEEVLPPVNMIIDEYSFSDLLNSHSILFFGNGSAKWKEITRHPNARFEAVEATAEHMVVLSYKAYQERHFTDLAYSEPFYGKEFYSPSPRTPLQKNGE